MRIALISPSHKVFSSNNKIQTFFETSRELAFLRDNWYGVNYGLLIVAALTSDKHQIELFDENFDEIVFSNDYDLVAISVMTPLANRAYQIADHFRELKVPVVLGGLHPTVLPNEAKEHADCVAIGEAEGVWPRILIDAESNQLKDFYSAEASVDLTQSPIPKYELLKPNRYKIIWVQSSRGCPHDCEFCGASRVYGKKYRLKTEDQVIKEIERIKQVHGNVGIGFSDDNFLSNKNRSKQLLARLVPLQIRWYALSDVSVGEDLDLIRLMKKSGCVNLFLGFESLTENSLKEVNNNSWKYKRLKNYSEYIKVIQSNGISIMGAFIIGFDADDTPIFESISNFIINNNIHTNQITFLTPLPGTRLRERLEKENRLLPTNWDKYGFLDITFSHPKLSYQELEDGLLNVYKKVYDPVIVSNKMDYFKNIYLKLHRETL